MFSNRELDGDVLRHSDNYVDVEDDIPFMGHDENSSEGPNNGSRARILSNMDPNHLNQTTEEA